MQAALEASKAGIVRDPLLDDATRQKRKAKASRQNSFIVPGLPEGHKADSSGSTEQASDQDVSQNDDPV